MDDMMRVLISIFGHFEGQAEKGEDAINNLMSTFNNI